MRQPIPAPGFTLTKGRKPRMPDDAKLLCQIRLMGWVDPVPWPIGTTDFRDTGAAGDVVAVRKID